MSLCGVVVMLNLSLIWVIAWHRVGHKPIFKCHGVSGHQHLDCLFNRLLWLETTIKQNIKALYYWPYGSVRRKAFPDNDVIVIYTYPHGKEL